MRVDVHQHLWTEPFVAALARRSRLPFIRGDRRSAAVHVAGEAASGLDLDAERPAARTAQLDRDQLDVALIAFSSPLGVERLPRLEAQALIDAHLDGVTALPPRFRAWGPLALDGLRAEDIDAVLARGVVGVSLPAGACASPSLVERLHPILARVAALGAPLFIHPGPGLLEQPSDHASGDPPWWPALTAYVAQMQAAWLALSTLARREHPQLRIVYAMLAGGAPLLSERLVARGGPRVEPRDSLSFYDCSSYGPVAVEAMAARVGPAQLLYGSDRPVIEPVSAGRDEQLRENADWIVAARTGVRT
jgi:6-methylsalicylate decarboxylase